MTESMIERVTATVRAYLDEFSGEATNYSLSKWIAKAVIETMREPTELMLDANPEDGVMWDEYTRACAASSYRTMIDAALQWPPGSADRAGVPLARD